jgi:DNA polymerase-3 subunit gamma/tau
MDDTPPWGEVTDSPPASAVSEEPVKKAEPPEVKIETTHQGEGVKREQSLAPKTLDELDSQTWIALLEVIGLSGMTYNIAANATVGETDNSQSAPVVGFQLPSRQIHLFNATHQQRIEEALSNYFNAAVKVDFIEAEPKAETPAQYRDRRNKERMAEAVAALQGDANVQAMIERYDRVLDIGSIKPVDPE